MLTPRNTRNTQYHASVLCVLTLYVRRLLLAARHECVSLHGVRACMSVHVNACLSELVVERVRGRVSSVVGGHNPLVRVGCRLS